MSLAGQRQEIADALSTVDVVQGHAVRGHRYRPRVIGAGDAWPLVDELTRTDEVPDFQVSWRVVVALDPDEQTASVWFDANHEQVAESLETFGYPSRIQPGLIPTSAGDIQAMIITVRREA